MYGFDSTLGSIDQCDLETESALSAKTILLLLTGVAGATYAIVLFAESNNRLNYDSRFARIIAGLIMLMMRVLHTKSGDLEFTDTEEPTLFAIGPHRTALDAPLFASKFIGRPPRYLATDGFNKVPGVSSLLKMSKAIMVAANPTNGDNGRSANASVLDLASKALSEKDCVALFPQGNLSKIGQEPPRVYTGVAKLALRNKLPIHVVRLDGFWSLQNPLIPISIRNSTIYRIFLSAVHINNVRATLCCKIDFHLKPENESLSDEEKIGEMCAQLYAYYRHTEELTAKEIEGIKPEIASKAHLLIWKNKVQRDDLGKQLLKLQKEGAELEGNHP